MLYFYEVYNDSLIPTTTTHIVFPRVVSEAMNDWLVQVMLEEEVRKTLFSLRPGKAPEPDGFTSNFFHRFWPEISTVLGGTRDFFLWNPLLQSVNHTLITLVPKKPTASELVDFRPISCVNFNI